MDVKPVLTAESRVETVAFRIEPIACRFVFQVLNHQRMSTPEKTVHSFSIACPIAPIILPVACPIAPVILPVACPIAPMIHLIACPTVPVILPHHAVLS